MLGQTTYWMYRLPYYPCNRWLSNSWTVPSFLSSGGVLLACAVPRHGRLIIYDNDRWYVIRRFRSGSHRTLAISLVPANETRGSVQLSWPAQLCLVHIYRHPWGCGWSAKTERCDPSESDQSRAHIGASVDNLTSSDASDRPVIRSSTVAWHCVDQKQAVDLGCVCMPVTISDSPGNPVPLFMGPHPSDLWAAKPSSKICTTDGWRFGWDTDD